MIYEIYKIKEIERYIKKNTLIAFDLDNTLVTTSSYYGSVNWEDAFISKLIKQGLSLAEAKSQVGKLWDKAQFETKLTLIEKEASLLIKKWKKQSIIIGLTARAYKLKDLTHKNLKSNNIVFSSFKDHGIDIFHEGILFCSETLKSKVLSNFITKALSRNLPEELLVVDDKIENLQDILSSHLEKDFNVKCFHYLNTPIYDNS